MTLEKMPSGNWRASFQRNKKRLRIVYDHKPSKHEMEADFAELMAKKGMVSNHKLTFRQAAEKYVETKKKVLSPNTVRDYLLIPGRMSDWFCDMNIDMIEQLDINRQINELAGRLSPKTIKNIHGFISAVLGTFRPEMKIHTTLPQNVKKSPYIPSDSDIQRLREEFHGTEYFIPFILGCFGMRRGEILALTPKDIDGDVVHINKAIAIDSDRKIVNKSTKTTESTRDIIIPKDIADMIKQQGYVYKGHPGNLNRALTRAQDKLGIEHFPFHKLRHYFASKMITITDSKTVQALGGWKTDAVMKNVYAHSMKEEQERAKREAVNCLNRSIF